MTDSVDPQPPPKKGEKAAATYHKTLHGLGGVLTKVGTSLQTKHAPKTLEETD